MRRAGLASSSFSSNILSKLSGIISLSPAGGNPYQKNSLSHSNFTFEEVLHLFLDWLCQLVLGQQVEILHLILIGDLNLCSLVNKRNNLQQWKWQWHTNILDMQHTSLHVHKLTRGAPPPESYSSSANTKSRSLTSLSLMYCTLVVNSSGLSLSKYYKQVTYTS